MIHLQFAEPSLEKEFNVEPEIIDNPSLLQHTAEETLRHTNTALSSEISIVIAGDNKLQELNRQFLGIDAPTDVIAFPSDEKDPDSGNIYLGDIIISYARALSQAENGGHSVGVELQLLVVHGVLHLLGYNHIEEKEKKRMWSLQAEILSHLGCPEISPSL